MTLAPDLAALNNADPIAQMTASLENFTLTPRKDGFHVKFFVDLGEIADVTALTEAIQRVVILKVYRRPRQRKGATPLDDELPGHFLRPLAFTGEDD